MAGRQIDEQVQYHAKSKKNSLEIVPISAKKNNKKIAKKQLDEPYKDIMALLEIGKYRSL